MEPQSICVRDWRRLIGLAGLEVLPTPSTLLWKQIGRVQALCISRAGRSPNSRTSVAFDAGAKDLLHLKAANLEQTQTCIHSACWVAAEMLRKTLPALHATVLNSSYDSCA